MFIRKLMGDLSANTSPDIVDYLLMKVEDAEYPTAAPLAAIALAGAATYYTVTGISRTFGLFADNEEKQHKNEQPFFKIDGP